MKIRLNFVSISLNHHPIVTSFCIYSISNSFIHISCTLEQKNTIAQLLHRVLT